MLPVRLRERGELDDQRAGQRGQQVDAARLGLIALGFAEEPVAASTGTVPAVLRAWPPTTSGALRMLTPTP